MRRKTLQNISSSRKVALIYTSSHFPSLGTKNANLTQVIPIFVPEMPYLESALVSTKTVPASLSDFSICEVKQEPLDHHSEEPNSQKAAEKSNPDDWCLLEVKENDFEVFDEPEFKHDLIIPIRLHLEER